MHDAKYFNVTCKYNQSNSCRPDISHMLMPGQRGTKVIKITVYVVCQNEMALRIDANRECRFSKRNNFQMFSNCLNSKQSPFTLVYSAPVQEF